MLTFKKIFRFVLGFILGTLLLLFLGLGSFFIYDAKPWKEKDPTKSGFDITKFDPNDYKNHTEIAKVLRNLLVPKTTTRADLDMLWCKRRACGRALTSEHDQTASSRFVQCSEKIGATGNNLNPYVYLLRGKNLAFGGWTLWVFFDGSDKLVNLCADDVLVFDSAGDKQ